MIAKMDGIIAKMDTMIAKMDAMADQLNNLVETDYECRAGRGGRSSPRTRPMTSTGPTLSSRAIHRTAMASK